MNRIKVGVGILVLSLCGGVSRAQSCPDVSPFVGCDFAVVNTIEVHNITKWTHTEGWPCDGTVRWEMNVGGQGWVKFGCPGVYDGEGNPVFYCPVGASIVKWANVQPFQAVVVGVRTCWWDATATEGCSVPCEEMFQVNQDFCEFTTREELLTCMGVGNGLPPGDLEYDSEE